MTAPSRDTAAIKAANAPIDVMTRLAMTPRAVRGRLQAACPSCGKRDKFDVDAVSGAFNCFVCADVAGGDVIALVQCVRSCSFLAACDWLGGDGGLTAADRARLEREQAARARQQAEADSRKEAADRAEMSSILQQLQPAPGTPVQAYLEGRGLKQGLINLGWIDADGAARAWPKDISFHPDLPLWAGPKGGRVKVGLRPAMVSLARNAQGQIVALHRTFLSVDPDTGRTTKVGGSFEIKGERLPVKAKQILGSVGAADRGVWLGCTTGITDDPRVCSLVAEGIENALAVASCEAPGSYWAALSLGRLVGTTRPNGKGSRGFTFPPNGRHRIVLGDNDLSPTLKDPDLTPEQAPELSPEMRLGGVRRAHAAMDRARDRLSETGDRVATVLPPVGLDFNDWLNARAEEETAG